MASFQLDQHLTEFDKDVIEIERDVGVGTDKYFPKMKPNITKKRRTFLGSHQFQGRSSESTIFGLAYNREHGRSSHNSFSVSEIPTTRMKTLSVMNIFRLVDDELDVSDCEFVRGGLDGRSVVGLWTGDQYNSIMYKLEFELCSKYSKTADEMPVVVSKVKKKGPFFTKTRVVDLCDTFYKQLSCVLYAGLSDTGRSMDCISVLCSYTTSPPSMGSLLLACQELNCCAGSRLGDVFAMGTENGVYVYSFERLIPMPECVENITSVEFNKSSNVLYCGTSASSVIVLDIREQAQHIHTSNIADLCGTGVSETKLFSDENLILISGFDGSLSKADLRTNKVVQQYPGHVGNGRKIPFSFSEHLNMVCATGSDNMTRLWSLDSGTLLSTIRPHYPENKVNSFLVCNNDKWAVTLFQRGNMYTLEPSI